MVILLLVGIIVSAIGVWWLVVEEIRTAAAVMKQDTSDAGLEGWNKLIVFVIETYASGNVKNRERIGLESYLATLKGTFLLLLGFILQALGIIWGLLM